MDASHAFGARYDVSDESVMVSGTGYANSSSIVSAIKKGTC
jgi:ActR/RegA family two-component response regulator